jgi:glutathione peroxidase-family protein
MRGAFNAHSLNPPGVEEETRDMVQYNFGRHFPEETVRDEQCEGERRRPLFEEIEKISADPVKSAVALVAKNQGLLPQ